MTSKIKVDNIENQCGGAVVTKCGATTTIAGTNVNATTVTATNVVGSTAVKSDNIQAADGGNIINQCGTTITLGASGDTINLASGASQSGFGRTGTVDWDTTPKTATFSAVSGDGYFCNTTSSAFTVNLPAGRAGAIVSLADYAATWQTNNLTVSPNGTDKIGSFNQNVTLSTEGQSVTFVYVDSTQGWINTMDSTSNVRGAPPFITATGGTITCCGDYKIHTFTGPGTFTVNQVSTTPSDNIVSYMVVAGGGGGGQGVGGGGGAGGFRENKSPVDTYTASPLEGSTDITITATAFPITVGGGGAGGSGNGSSGNNSIFSTIISTGGGGGSRNTPGGDGGSGGGGYIPSSPQYLKGSGNTPPVSPPQGNPGGEGNSAGAESGGGGGGAGATGGNGTNNPSNPNDGGPGGNGVTTNITGSPVTRAGGGGGSGFTGTGGAGGSGGGGDSGPGRSQGAGTNGTANTGGGAGAGNYPGPSNSGGAGGSGIVIIRYKFQ